MVADVKNELLGGEGIFGSIDDDEDDEDDGVVVVVFAGFVVVTA